MHIPLYLSINRWTLGLCPPFAHCEYTVCFCGHEMKKVGLRLPTVEKQPGVGGLVGRLDTERKDQEAKGN